MKRPRFVLRWIAALTSVLGLSAVAVASAATGPPAPVLGRNVDLRLVHGRVLIQEPGQRATALRGARQVPVGTLIDSSNGQFALIAAGSSAGRTHSGQFSGDQVRVLQSSSEGGLTKFQFAQPLACGQASIAKIRRSRKHRIYAAADGDFETSGRFGTATAANRADWTTTDDCGGTHIADLSGAVETDLGGRSSGLAPGVTGVGYCTGLAPDRTHFKRCINALSFRRSGFGFGLVVREPASRYRLCLSGPKGADGCHSLPLRHDDFLNAQVSVALCPADQGAGAYVARWTIDGRPVGIPLSIAAARRAVPWQCHDFPTGNFGKEVGLEVGSGKVFVAPPGQLRHRVRGSLRVPLDTLLDLRQGAAEVNSMSRADLVQIGSFFGSEVAVTQPTGQNGTTYLRMTGGDFRTCKAGQFRIVRGLSAKQASNAFVVAGRFAVEKGVSASSSAVMFDRCDGTFTQDTSGRVVVADAFEEFGLVPDTSATYQCSDTSSRPSTCVAVVTQRNPFFFVFHLGLHTPATHYTFCVGTPTGRLRCVTPVLPAPSAGQQISDLNCVVNAGKGTYDGVWDVNGRIAGFVRFDVTLPRESALPQFKCAIR